MSVEIVVTAWLQSNSKKTKRPSPYKAAVQKGSNMGHLALNVTINRRSKLIGPFRDILTLADITYADEDPTYRGEALQNYRATLSVWPQKANVKTLFKMATGGNISPDYSTMETDMGREFSKENPANYIRHYFAQDHHNNKRYSPISDLQQKLKALKEEQSSLKEDYDNYNKRIELTISELKKIQSDFDNRLTFEKTSPPFNALKALDAKRKYTRSPAARTKIMEILASKNNTDALDGKELSKQINYGGLINTLINLRSSLPKNKESFINLFKEEERKQEVGQLVDEYVQYLNQLTKNDDFAEKSLGELNLLIIPEQIKMIAVADNIDNKVLDPFLLDLEKIKNHENAIIRLAEIQKVLINIEEEKERITARQLTINTEILSLNMKINTSETTKGEHPHVSLPLPSKRFSKKNPQVVDPTKPFYIDEELLLESIREHQQKKSPYSLFHNNCATHVKDCVIAAIKADEKLSRALENLPEMPKNFLQKNRKYFLVRDTIESTLEWFTSLNGYINLLNERYLSTLQKEAISLPFNH